MEELVDDFLSYLRNERGQSQHTQKTYAALLGKFLAWAKKHGLTDWKSVELSHLAKFLEHERERTPAHGPEGKKLSGESIYLEIAALRAFYKFCENERLLPVNVAENLSLPRRWKRLPRALTDAKSENCSRRFNRRHRHRSATRRFWNWPMRRGCVCPSCVICDWSSSTWTPGSSMSLARETRNASCRWAGKPSRRCSVFRGRPAPAGEPTVAGEVFFLRGAARRLPP